MHQYQESWLAITPAVVYYARATHTFSAGINYRHCSFSLPIQVMLHVPTIDEITRIVSGLSVK